MERPAPTPIRRFCDQLVRSQEIMQELLRHSTIRVTLDAYTQAVTTEKRNAQEAVVALLFPEKARNASSAWLNTITCTYLVPFCAHAKMEHFR